MPTPFSSDPESVDALLAQICRLHYMRAHVLLEEIGLYRGQPPVLFHLHHQDGLTLTELVARLDVTPATVTKMVQRLERAGFVKRVPDGEDQRVTRVYLTDAGRVIQRDMRAALLRLEGETFAGFNAADQGLIAKLLTRVRDNLTQATQQAAPEADGNKPERQTPGRGTHKST
jgi:MarR family transcriptional regulator, organic hydroperoxide resistance regulator